MLYSLVYHGNSTSVYIYAIILWLCLLSPSFVSNDKVTVLRLQLSLTIGPISAVLCRRLL